MTLATEQYRPLMFGIAYRMLGSVAEAEDVVQEAFLRMHERPADMDSPKAYAATVTTRIAIDELRSARKRRERYVGTWLPEPIITAGADDPQANAELRESISLAFLAMLERLTPVERAVFVLREAFGYGFEEIGRIVDKTDTNCRQILTRARGRLAETQPRFPADPDRRDELARAFVAAATTGDLAGLEQVLAEDVVFYGDGGGKAQAVREPVFGRLRVARFIAGIGRQAERYDARVEPLLVNGDPGGRIVDPSGRVFAVFALEIADGQIVAIRNVLNPDKLRHLGPVFDVPPARGG